MSNGIQGQTYEDYKSGDKFYLTRKELILSTLSSSKKDILDKKKKHKALSLQISNSQDSSSKKQLLQVAGANIEEIKSDSDIYKKSLELYEQQGIEAYKDIKSVQDLKDVITSDKNNFWADEWCISTLERLYNVKFLIFAQFNYDSKNPGLENNNEVLLCGTSDPEIEKQRIKNCWSYRTLNDHDWNWCIDFLEYGGKCL